MLRPAGKAITEAPLVCIGGTKWSNLPGLARALLLTAWVRELVLILAWKPQAPAQLPAAPVRLSAQHGPCPSWLGHPVTGAAVMPGEWGHAGGITGLVPGLRIWG